MPDFPDDVVERAARAICISYGYDPDDDAPVEVVCGPNNEYVPLWCAYEEQATAAIAAAWGWKPIAGPVDTSKAPWDGKFYLLYDSSCESEYMSDRWDEQYSRWDCGPESTPTHYCVPTAPEVKP